MNYNTDGFNERTNYIHNSNDINRLRKNGPSNSDSSFAQMKINENKPDVETVNHDENIILEEVHGTKDNFIIRNKNIMNANSAPAKNNPVSNALNRNMFKKF